ncbi:DnaJ domain-containing protein [Rhabdaerophilum calidifontis]|uniref:DnaJ domain-containing protein n=1 Tax=Rhabdaerophilum calidifontis TaxID=2604328 RepID=UPI00140CE463|nr:DnaJ domain-containing protein [Rhabdaerophilum calidifontis]
MNYLVSMIVFGAVVWWFALGPGRKAGDSLSPLTRKLVGAVAGGAGILLALKGRWDVAIVLVSLAAWLLGFRLPAAIDPIGRARRSEIRTRALEITIDLGDGSLDARIVLGVYAGRMLTALGAQEALRLAHDLSRIDPQGLALIAQDLDRRAPGWREHVQFDPQPREGAAPAGPEMRDDEAYQILGLEPGAREDEIRAAHRALIARLHPDRGGSNHLAALVNRAKDVALAAARRG